MGERNGHFFKMQRIEIHFVIDKNYHLFNLTNYHLKSSKFKQEVYLSIKLIIKFCKIYKLIFCTLEVVEFRHSFSSAVKKEEKHLNFH